MILKWPLHSNHVTPVQATSATRQYSPSVDERTSELFRLLARALLWGAAAVLVLSIIGAIAIASSQSQLGLFADVERQGRAVGAIAALAGGITGAGILAALGAILQLLLDRTWVESEVEPHRENPPGDDDYDDD